MVRWHSFFLKRSIEASSPKNHWKCKKAKMRRKNLHKFLKISDPQRVSLQAVFWQRPTRETGREGRSFVNHQGPEGSQWSYVVLVEGVMELWKILETMAHWRSVSLIFYWDPRIYCSTHGRKSTRLFAVAVLGLYYPILWGLQEAITRIPINQLVFHGMSAKGFEQEKTPFFTRKKKDTLHVKTTITIIVRTGIVNEINPCYKNMSSFPKDHSSSSDC